MLKYISVFVVLCSVQLFSQNVAVTFYYKPTVASFTTVRLAGSFENWSITNSAYIMSYSSSDGMYKFTANLAPGTYQYKFVVDAAYFPDPNNPVYDGSQYMNSQITVSDPMITYLLPIDTNSVTMTTLPHVKAVFAFNPATDLSAPVITLTINGQSISPISAYYDTVKKIIDYPITGYVSIGKNTIQASIKVGTHSTSKIITLKIDPDPKFSLLTEDMIYKKANIVVYGKITTHHITSIAVTLNGTPFTAVIDSTNNIFTCPVTLTNDSNIVSVTMTSLAGTNTQTQTLIYRPDDQPVITISNYVNGRIVFLSSTATSPGGYSLSYLWYQDVNNPEQISIQNAASQNMQVTIPATTGEYIFKVKVTDNCGKYEVAGYIVKAAGDSVRIEGLDEHPGWVDKMRLYEVYSPSYGVTKTGLKGVLEKLDDLAALGINAIWMTPIFDGNYNGYAEINYYKVNPVLGTEDDLRQIVQKAHQLGIKILLDLVINHTWTQHPFFQNVLALKAQSPFANYYLWLSPGIPGISGFSTYNGWTDLPNMNVNNPELEDYLYNVAAYWVREYDIDGYRCDVASGIDDRNPVFWQEMRRRLKKLKPELFLLGESAADNIMSGFTLNIFNHKFDAAYDWELRGFGTGALNNLFKGTSNTAVLSSVIPKIYGTNDYAMRFVENHDFLRATSEFGLKQSKLAHTVVFTIGGVPLIYGGGEVGELSQLNQINWNDPNNFKPYFAKLLDIRKKYIKNDAQVTTLSNSNSAMVETYITKSDTSTLLTVANFAGSSASLTINFGNNIQDSSVYVYDLFQDTSLFVTSSQLNSLTFNLSGSEAKVYRLQNYNITSVSGDPGLVYKYQLDQNYPNPFNPSTIISYSIAESEIVKVAVYDILGREVATLVNQSQNAGSYKVNWNGKNKSGQSVTSGIYLYTIKAGNYNSAKKMILMK